MSRQTNRSMERIGSPEIDPYVYGELSFNKDGKEFSRERRVFLIDDTGIIGIYTQNNEH